MDKLKTKIDHLLWAFMWLLPVLAFFVQYYRAGAELTLLQYVDTHYAFDFIKNILDTVWETAFSCELKISGYLSYLVVVEIAHCLFDVIVFIPRFAHELIDRGTHLCRKEK